MALSYQFGVNDSHLVNLTGSYLTNNLQLAAGLGCYWLRADLGWATVDPTLGTGPSYQASAAQLVNSVSAAAAAYGMKLMIPLAVGTGGGLFPAGSTPTQYADMAAWLVGQCPGLTWEILNEPDFSGTPASTYAAVLKAAYPAMKAADPTCTVAGCVLANIQPAPHGDGQAYMTSLYADGILGNYDAVSVHTYDFLNSTPPVPYNPETNLGMYLTQFRAIMAANGDSATPLWITEWGWDSNNSAFGTVGQAQTMQLWMQELESLDIPVVVQYQLVEGVGSGIGLVTPTFVPKLAYYYTQNLNGVTTAHMAKIGSSHYVLLRVPNAGYPPIEMFAVRTNLSLNSVVK